MNARAYPSNPPVLSPSPRSESQRRQAEYQALRELADQVVRLNREMHRERSYTSHRYAG